MNMTIYNASEVHHKTHSKLQLPAVRGSSSSYLKLTNCLLVEQITLLRNTTVTENIH